MNPEIVQVPSLEELVQALPSDWQTPSTRDRLEGLIQTLSHKPMPTGRFRRGWSMGSLQAKVAVGYGLHRVRGLLSKDDEKQRIKQEAALNAALKVFEGMAYLRGAVMKVGQGLASFPSLLPSDCYRIMSTLQFEAPPMHFSLLREQVMRELGAAPEDLFAEFDPHAFAAASLGQVHRARLKSGELVAVKIQYPGIARAIASDLANLRTLSAPMRLTADWDNMVERIDDMRATLEEEADYRREARNAKKARKLLQGYDEIVIPKVHEAFSSERVLTMEYLEGEHLPEYLERAPSQEDRNRRAEQIVRSGYRLMFQRFLLSDPNPGNFLFLPDGRLGLIDFGCCREFTDQEWEWTQLGVRACHGNDRKLEEQVLRDCSSLSEKEMSNQARVDLTIESLRWVWEPIRSDQQPFDFSDAEFMERGLGLVSQLVVKQWTRAEPMFTWLNRMLYGVRGLLHSLEAKVDYRKIDREETERVGL